MLDWAAISGILLPHLKVYVTNGAAKLSSSAAGPTATKLYKKFSRSGIVAKANKTFVLRFSEELYRSLDIPKFNSRMYEEALACFLANTSVQDIIQAPLDGESQLDWELLRSTWTEFKHTNGQRLAELPTNFDWPALARMYRKGLHAEMLVSSDLRPILHAIAAKNAAEMSERAALAAERLAGPIDTLDFARYAASIKVAYAHLRLGSLDTDWTQFEGAVRLESVYVPQSAKQALPPRDVTRDYRRLLLERKRRGGISSAQLEQVELHYIQRQRDIYESLSSTPILDVITENGNRRLVILGDPGLGKSTLLKSLTLHWAENSAQTLVLFVELRRASRELGFSNFLQYLEKGENELSSLPAIQLDAYLKNNSVLVLFDGLDEVSDASRSATVSDIIHFAERYSKARVIVTTRVYGYYPGSTHPEQFRDARFRQFTLQDFNEAQIDQFLSSWHKEAFKHIPDRERYEARIRRAIEDSPAIRELAANPLLLTLMAMLGRTQDLPRDRSRLYERCAELLLKNWDLEKFPELKGKRQYQDVKDKLGPDQKMRILERVAAAMQEERAGLAGNLIGQERLQEIISAELERLGVLQPTLYADDLIWMLRERNFMLGYLGDKQYAFIHRTFLEYFCAREIKYRFERTSSFPMQGLQDLFRQNWMKDEWHEVLRLLCGMIGAEHASKCLDTLLEFRRNVAGYRAVLLAAQCVQEIREIGSVRDVRSRILKALFQAVKPDFFSVFYKDIDYVKHKSASKIRADILREIARGWKEQPEILPWIKQRALLDSDADIAQAAVQQVTRVWPELDDLFDWLKQVVAAQASGAARQAAVQELARRWRHYPGMFNWLKNLAREDASSYVRIAAAQELARGWEDEHGLLDFLLRIEENDKDWTVRDLIAREIVATWKDEPKAQELSKYTRSKPPEYELN